MTNKNIIPTLTTAGIHALQECIPLLERLKAESDSRLIETSLHDARVNLRSLRAMKHATELADALEDLVDDTDGRGADPLVLRRARNVLAELDEQP